MEGVNKDSIFHFDARVLRNRPIQDPATGFVRLDCTLGVSGVLTYRNAVGARRELRTDEANRQLEAYIKSMTFPLSMTVEHPPEMISAKNYSMYNKGDIDKSAVRFDAPELIAPVVVCDQDAIRQVLGNKQYSSLGYLCSVLKEPGTYRGEAYDLVQTNIIPNHVCCTSSPRAGDLSKFHFRMDSNSGDLQVWEQCEDDYPTEAKRYFFMPNEMTTPIVSASSQQQPLFTYNHGNVSYRVPSELIPVLQRQDSLIEQLSGDKNAVMRRLDSLQAKYDNAVAECRTLEDSNNELQGTIDAYLENNKGGRNYRMDSSNSQNEYEDEEDAYDDETEEEYQERTDAMNNVQAIVNFGLRFDGFSEVLQGFYPEDELEAMRLVYGVAYQRTDAADLPIEYVGQGYNELLEEYERQIDLAYDNLEEAFDLEDEQRTDSVGDIAATMREIEARNPELSEVFDEYSPRSVVEAKAMELAYMMEDSERVDALTPTEIENIHAFTINNFSFQQNNERTDSNMQSPGSQNFDLLMSNRSGNNPQINDLISPNGKYGSPVTKREKNRAAAYLPK